MVDSSQVITGNAVIQRCGCGPPLGGRAAPGPHSEGCDVVPGRDVGEYSDLVSVGEDSSPVSPGGPLRWPFLPAAEISGMSSALSSGSSDPLASDKHI